MLSHMVMHDAGHRRPGGPVLAAGEPGLAAGSPGLAAGTPGLAAGTPGLAAGTPGLAAGTALLAVADTVAEADAAVAAGADVVDLGSAGRAAITAFRTRHPGVLVCASDEPADLVRDVAAARASGAVLICADVQMAEASGLPARQVLINVPAALVRAAAADGWATLVDADHEAGTATGRTATGGGQAGDGTATDDTPADGTGDTATLAGLIAIAAISSWLGAAVVRTRRPSELRRALDMAASVRGIRPPARAVRGLA